MKHATFHLLEVMATTMKKIARATIHQEDFLSSIEEDLTGALTSAKLEHNRELQERYLPTVANTVFQILQYLSGEPIISRFGRTVVEQKSLLQGIVKLQRREQKEREMASSFLHPSGQCTCAGEGECEWRESHCNHCGQTIPDKWNIIIEDYVAVSPDLNQEQQDKIASVIKPIFELWNK